jgi:hypothetical protein
MGRRQAPIGWHLPEFRPWRDRWRVRRLRGCSWKRLRMGSAARMRVQVQVRLATLPETPLYKAI